MTCIEAIKADEHVCREVTKPTITLDIVLESDGFAKGRHKETGTELCTKYVTQVRLVTTKKESEKTAEKYFRTYLISLNFVVRG